MSAHQELLEQILRQHGQSVTAGRRLILDILWQQRPMTIGQIVDRANNKLDRASIYRTLALFEQLAIIQRITIGWKQQIELSGPFSHHHHHLSCLDCGAVEPVDNPKIEAILSTIASQRGFTLQQHQLEIQGYCPACSRRHHKDSGLPTPG